MSLAGFWLPTLFYLYLPTFSANWTNYTLCECYVCSFYYGWLLFFYFDWLLRFYRAITFDLTTFDGDLPRYKENCFWAHLRFCLYKYNTEIRKILMFLPVQRFIHKWLCLSSWRSVNLTTASRATVSAKTYKIETRKMN